LNSFYNGLAWEIKGYPFCIYSYILLNYIAIFICYWNSSFNAGGFYGPAGQIKWVSAGLPKFIGADIGWETEPY